MTAPIVPTIRDKGFSISIFKNEKGLSLNFQKSWVKKEFKREADEMTKNGQKLPPHMWERQSMGFFPTDIPRIQALLAKAEDQVKTL